MPVGMPDCPYCGGTTRVKENGKLVLCPWCMGKPERVRTITFYDKEIDKLALRGTEAALRGLQEPLTDPIPQFLRFACHFIRLLRQDPTAIRFLGASLVMLAWHFRLTRKEALDPHKPIGLLFRFLHEAAKALDIEFVAEWPSEMEE